MGCRIDRRGLLDPKGNVVLMAFPDKGGRVDALVFRGGERSQFVYAFDYDASTGEWSQGRYFSDPCRAYFAANPRILEDSATWWELGDFRRALEEQGMEPDEDNVETLIEEVRGMKGWLERAIASGNDEIAEAADWLAHEDGQDRG